MNVKRLNGRNDGHYFPIDVPETEGAALTCKWSDRILSTGNTGLAKGHPALSATEVQPWADGPGPVEQRVQSARATRRQTRQRRDRSTGPLGGPRTRLGHGSSGVPGHPERANGTRHCGAAYEPRPLLPAASRDTPSVGRRGCEAGVRRCRSVGRLTWE